MPDNQIVLEQLRAAFSAQQSLDKAIDTLATTLSLPDSLLQTFIGTLYVGTDQAADISQDDVDQLLSLAEDPALIAHFAEQDEEDEDDLEEDDDEDLEEEDLEEDEDEDDDEDE